MISSIQNTGLSARSSFFGTKNATIVKKEQKNPITEAGERSNLVLATFLGGLTVGGRVLFELWGDNGDDLFDLLGSASSKMVNKAHKNVDGIPKLALYVLAAAALTLAAVSVFALAYTAYNIPKINYNAKLNGHNKAMDMDVYIKSTNIEKELYGRLAQEAKGADVAKKEELATAHAQLGIVKSKMPEFINLK